MKKKQICKFCNNEKKIVLRDCNLCSKHMLLLFEHAKQNPKDLPYESSDIEGSNVFWFEGGSKNG